MKRVLTRSKEKQKERSCVFVPASFTVEASLLMGIILPVLIGILLAGFYVHDQAYLQGIACEVSGMGSSMALYSDREAQMQQTMKKRTGRSVLWVRGINRNSSVSKTSSRASVSASFRFPAVAAVFFGRETQALESSAVRKIYHPADLIRTFKGARDLMDDY